jgi:hypothetical protein
MSARRLIFVLDGTHPPDAGRCGLCCTPAIRLHFMGDTPHSFANIGEGPARLLWTGTSPRLIGRSPERP